MPTRKHLKTFVKFWFREQTKIGQRSSIYKKSLFTTVLITNNGHLDQRTWFKNDILEDFLESGVHTLRRVTTDTQRYRELKTPPAPLHLWDVQRVSYVEFGAQQLSCTPDLSKRPQNKSKSWQETIALFSFTNKHYKTTFLAIYSMTICYCLVLLLFSSVYLRLVCLCVACIYANSVSPDSSTIVRCLG